MTGRALLRRSRLTQAAFGLIIAFLIAQVAWWLWFQAHYIADVSESTARSWQEDAEVANRLAQIDLDIALELLIAHPHLRFADGRFLVDQASLDSFIGDQRAAVRMFVFEGVFFVLVVLAGLWILARSLAVARELERRQHNFLLAVSHEFRTPVSTLRLLIDSLQYREPTSEKLADYLGRMQRELTRLERSSDQVLASARLEQPRVSGDVLVADLNDALMTVIEKLRRGFEARGAELTLELTDEPLPVLLEPESFESIVANLVDNAVKYSPEAHKPVRLAASLSGDSALLTVEDRGVGVPAEERDRVFERFYRPGSEMTRRSQGIGLGLYLVRSNVERLGGQVTCEDRTDGESGARFVITLPLQARAGASIPPARVLPTAGALGK